MLNHDILVLRQYNYTIELYCNCYDYGYERLEYYLSSNASNKTTINLTDNFIAISDLYSGKYVFNCYNDNDEACDELTVEIINEDFAGFVDRVIPESAFNLINEDIDNFAPATFLVDLVNFCRLKEWDSEDTSQLIKSIEAVTSNINNMNQYMNNQDDFATYIDNCNILKLTANDYNYLEDMNLVCYKCVIDSNYSNNKKYTWDIYKNITLRDKEYTTKLPEGLYKLELYKDGNLARQYYYYGIPESISKERFDAIITDLENKAQMELTSLSILPSGYEFESAEEKDIIINLEAGTDKIAMFERPYMSYIDGIISVDLSNCYDFISAVPNTTFYLCAVSSDEIYYDNITPIKVDISATNFNFDPFKYFFMEEPYYFYIADENGNKITRTTYLDLTDIVYGDEESTADEDTDDNNPTDYNERYQDILWQTYVKDLNSIVSKSDNTLWNTIEDTLDYFILTSDHGYKDITEWLLQRVMEKWNERYKNICWIIIYAYMCKYRYYCHKSSTRQNAQFVTGQISKPQYRTHIIPSGNYVLAITYYNINSTEITHKYIYSNNTAIEFRIDEADYTVFQCIDLTNKYQVSDFGIYCNTDYDTIDYRFNSLDVEILKGL